MKWIFVILVGIVAGLVLTAALRADRRPGPMAYSAGLAGRAYEGRMLAYPGMRRPLYPIGPRQPAGPATQVQVPAPAQRPLMTPLLIVLGSLIFLIVFRNNTTLAPIGGTALMAGITALLGTWVHQ